MLRELLRVKSNINIINITLLKIIYKIDFSFVYINIYININMNEMYIKNKVIVGNISEMRLEG
jgi:hypothetical protein